MSVSTKSEVNIRPAVSDDCAEIMRLIVELAVYEKMEDQVTIGIETLRKDLFGEHPRCQVLVAEPASGESKPLVGYALFYNIYSTWEGVSMHLEDLYVTPDYRGCGLGSRMWKEVAKVALEMDCGRLQLCVLGWNTTAKDWYERAGCTDLTQKEDWHMMRMTKDTMKKFVGL